MHRKTTNAPEKDLSSPRRLPVNTNNGSTLELGSCQVPVPCHVCDGMIHASGFATIEGTLERGCCQGLTPGRTSPGRMAGAGG